MFVAHDARERPGCGMRFTGFFSCSWTMGFRANCHFTTLMHKSLHGCLFGSGRQYWHPAERNSSKALKYIEEKDT